jgi:hypothetical protein
MREGEGVEGLPTWVTWQRKLSLDANLLLVRADPLLSTAGLLPRA